MKRKMIFWMRRIIYFVNKVWQLGHKKQPFLWQMICVIMDKCPLLGFKMISFSIKANALGVTQVFKVTAAGG